MKISADAWNKYKNRLSLINHKAAAEFTRHFVTEGGGYQNFEAADIVAYAYALATKYGEAAAAQACNMYDATAAAQNAKVPAAEPAATATYAETAKAIYGTLGTGNMPGAVSRLVKQAGADTALKNARRDGAQFAWIPQGDTCAFCIMLASNGWQYMSSRALSGGHAEHIHANCDCEYAVRFDTSSTVSGYDPGRYREMYRSADGSTSTEKLNSMRREQAALTAVKQDGGKATIPAAMQGDYSDFEPLSISETERHAFADLHEAAEKTGTEHAQVFLKDGTIIPFDNGTESTVYVPLDSIDSDGIKLYHSHTNDTPPSAQDLLWLTDERVAQVGVVTRNGDIFTAEVGDSRPTFEEFAKAAGEIAGEVNMDVMNTTDFLQMSLEERNYVAIREQFYRLCRNFKLKMEGGPLNEQ